MATEDVKIHRVLRETVRGVDYFKTFLIIPKEIENDMNLEAGTTMFLSVLKPGLLLLVAQRRYADDTPVTLSKYIHKKYKGQIYYNLRIPIPKRLEYTTILPECDEFDIDQSGKTVKITFKKRTTK